MKKQNFERFCLACGEIFLFWLAICWHGIKRIPFKRFDFWGISLIIWMSLFCIIYADYYHLLILHKILPGYFTSDVVKFLIGFGRIAHFLVISSGLIFTGLFFLGAVVMRRKKKYQNNLDQIGLKTATGNKAKVIEVITIDANKTKIIIASQGIGVASYESKKNDLRSAFGQIIESIREGHDRSNVEILLCNRELPKKISYYEVIDAAKEPYSFVVGESLSGTITQSIRSLPHLLIGGMSGQGKSVFFKQCLLGLLKTSPKIKLYLLDLKRGVEVKEFENIPHVVIAKNESESVEVLEELVEEMDRRFKYLESNKSKLIDPDKDNMDLLVVGIDEASVLYGKEKTSKVKKELVARARELTDELAKLGRASAIHLILATQKVNKETIDTKVQDNLGGRLCFRTTSVSGSNSILGNKKATELPASPGRAIWSRGNEEFVVQVPFLTDEEISDECSAFETTSDDQKGGKDKTKTKVTHGNEGAEESNFAVNDNEKKVDGE